MHILITGAAAFIGRNLLAHLEPAGHTLWPVDQSIKEAQLSEAIANADFVFHLLRADAPMEEAPTAEELAFTQTLLTRLESAKQPPVVMAGADEVMDEALAAYGQRTGAPVHYFHLAEVFGKWSRPNHRSTVATLCTKITRDLPVTLEQPDQVLQLCYIDDVTEALCTAMEGRTQAGHHSVEPVYTLTLGELALRLSSYKEMRNLLDVPDQSDGLTHKLYATYLSYLPPDDFVRNPVVHSDQRGSFTELLHMGGYGQLSLNVSKPGIVKGEHWHRTKHEKFIVIQGEGIIRLRKPGDSTPISYRVSGETRTVVDIPPGYAHNIENVGQEDLYTLMWINERFDPADTDAYPMPVTPPKTGGNP